MSPSHLRHLSIAANIFRSPSTPSQCSDKLGLSLELGFFAAGVMISTTDHSQHTLEQDVILVVRERKRQRTHIYGVLLSERETQLEEKLTKTQEELHDIKKKLADVKAQLQNNQYSMEEIKRWMREFQIDQVQE